MCWHILQMIFCLHVSYFSFSILISFHIYCIQDDEGLFEDADDDEDEEDEEVGIFFNPIFVVL